MPNFYIHFRAMGSGVQAWLNVPTAAEAEVLSKVPQWFAHYEALFSRFRPDSDVSQINQHAGDWVTVDPLTMQVIQAAQEAAALTDGLVNPLILTALEAAGYTHSFDPEHFQPGAQIDISEVPHWDSLEIASASKAVRIPLGAKLDLGGIAKGWAAEQTALRLAEVGACLVDAGGDMVARGCPAESDIDGWLVSCPLPENPAETGMLLLHDLAVATSGTNYRYWVRDGHVLHHLIDPRTGRSAQSEAVTATVVSTQAVHAEAWAKAALISGTLPPIPALLVFRDGSTTTNAGFQTLRSN